MRALCALLLAGTHTRWAAGFYPQLSSTSYRFHAPNSQHYSLEPPTHWVVTRWSFPRRRSAACATITTTVTTATTTTTTAGSSGSRTRSEATMSGGPLSRFRGAEASTAPAAAAVPWTRRRAADMRVRNTRTSSSLRIASRSGSVEHARCFHEGAGSGGGDTAAAPAAGAETSSGVNGATTAVAAAPRLLLGEDYGDSTAVAHEYLREFLGMTDEELQKLSTAYRALPPGRRGPDEITVAGPELAAAAAEAAEAAAATVVATATAAAVAVVVVSTSSTAAAAAASPSSSSSWDDGGGGGGSDGGEGGGGGGGGEAARQAGGAAPGAAATDVARAGAVRAASAKAASAAAGKVLIAEIPAIASVLHVQLGVSKERVKRLVLRWPRLLEVSGYNVGQCVEWLVETVGMTQEHVAKLVLAHPPIIIKSVKQQLQPNLNWLENDLGLTRPEVQKVVRSCPQLLVKSVSSNFLPKLEFFDKRIGIERDSIRGMLVRYPQLFNFSLDNMTWKARWLREELMLDRKELKGVLTRCPSVFAYSAERNLVPTIEFFLDELGATKMQIRQAVVKQPRLLGMSLETRLVPRLQELRGAGFTPSWQAHHGIMLFASDAVFRKWLEDEASGRVLAPRGWGGGGGRGGGGGGGGGGGRSDRRGQARLGGNEIERKFR